MKIDPPDYIKKLKPYVAGKPIEELEREYGVKNAVKLASNENPIGASPLAIKACQKSLLKINRYPDSSGHDLINKISLKFNIDKRSIVLGNGSDDIIALLCKAYVRPDDRVIIPDPGFLMYEISSMSEGADIVKVPLDKIDIDIDAMAKAADDKTSLIFITNPNNPTGSFISKKRLKEFMDKISKKVIVAVDEAYMEFANDYFCSWELIDQYPNLVTMRTFSKAYGLAGLRIGYGVMNPDVAEILNRVRQPFNTSLPAQDGACAALDDDEFLVKVQSLVIKEKEYLKNSLDELGFKAFDTSANFILIDLKRSADEIFEKLLYKGVITRSMSSYGFPNYLRLSIGLVDENRLFIKSLKGVAGL